MWEDVLGRSHGPATDEAETVVYTLPEVSISKSGPERACVDGSLSYTIKVCNVGGMAAGDVEVTDYLPDGVSYGSSDPAGVYDGVNHTVVWELGGIEPDECVDLTLTVDVDSGIGDGTVLNNLADVEWSYGGEGYGPVEDDWQTEVNTRPNLEIEKRGTEEAREGDEVTYEIEITNTGGSTAYDVEVSDILPQGLTYVSSDPAGNESGGVVSWTGLSDIASGGSLTVEVTAEIDFGIHEHTQLIDVAMVRWEDAGDNPYGPETDTVTTLVGPALRISKNAVLRYAFPGETITYTVNYENASGNNLTGVKVIETYDENVEYVSADPEPDTGTDDTWTIGTLAAGESGTIEIVVMVKSSLSEGVILRNDVIINASEEAESRDEEKNEVRYIPDLVVTKVDRLYTDVYSDGTISSGDVLEYSITIINNGEGEATDVVFSDTPDPATTLVPGSVYSSRGIITGGNEGIPPVIVSVGEVFPGESVEISFRVVIATVNYPGIITNQGLVSSYELPDILTDDPDTANSRDPTVTQIRLKSVVGGEVQGVDRTGLIVPWLGLLNILVILSIAGLTRKNKVRIR